MTTHLSAPLTLPSGLVLPNRFAKSAMSERLADRDGSPTLALTRLYRAWAEGGTGLVITGNAMVDRHQLGEPGNVVVDQRSSLPALARWARAASSGGAAVLVQLNHPGRQAPRTVSARPVAPSSVPMRGLGFGFARPRALTDEEIRAIIDRFATAAAIVERAGFHGVQIHGAHGYLVSQFLSPRTNLRDDRWGGSPENRRRFLIEVVRAVRRAVRPSFAVSVKLNSADFQRGGFSEDESVDVALALEAEGIDLLEVSGGTYESAAMMEERSARASTRAREAFFLEHAERVRARVRTPLLVTGGFRTREGMNTALASSALDVVGLARPLALEPDLPRRLLSGEADRALSIQVATGVKKLDGFIQASFYQAQLDRLGAGLPADPQMSRLAAALAYFLPRTGVAGLRTFGGLADPDASLVSRLRPAVPRPPAARP